MSQQNTPQQTPNQSHPDSLQAIIKTAMDVLLLIASIFAAPVELAIRRRQGTRYQNIVVMAFAAIPLWLSAGLGMTVGKSLNDNGLIGIGIMSVGFMVLQWAHFYHVWRMMCDPHREVYSYEDGVALPWWKQCPGGKMWTRVRLFWEPAFVVAVAAVGYITHLLSTAASIYLVLAAMALFVKVVFLWYRTWEYLREILDQYGLSQKLVGETAKSSIDAVKSAIANAARSIPSCIPTAALAAVRQTAKESLPAELKALISEAAPARGNDDDGQGALDLLSPA